MWQIWIVFYCLCFVVFHQILQLTLNESHPTRVYAVFTALSTMTSRVPVAQLARASDWHLKDSDSGSQFATFNLVSATIYDTLVGMA